MHHICRYLPLVILVLAGCASSPTSKLTAEYPEEQARVAKRIEEILRAAEKPDFDQLESYHAYGPKFTKFAPEAPNRMDAIAAREGERTGLARLNGLSMRADNLKIDILGNVAIATCVLDSTFKKGNESLEKQFRTTLIFVKDLGEWKITHEHLSLR
jgi:ketosteroid isomerase-like protein